MWYTTSVWYGIHYYVLHLPCNRSCVSQGGTASYKKKFESWKINQKAGERCTPYRYRSFDINHHTGYFITVWQNHCDYRKILVRLLFFHYFLNYYSFGGWHDSNINVLKWGQNNSFSHCGLNWFLQTKRIVDADVKAEYSYKKEQFSESTQQYKAGIWHISLQSFFYSIKQVYSVSCYPFKKVAIKK